VEWVRPEVEASGLICSVVREMNDWLLLEATAEERERLKAHGYSEVDSTQLGDYDMTLWHGQNTRNGRPVDFYEVSLSHGGLKFDSEEAQLGKQAGGSMDLLGRKSAMTSKFDEWLKRYDTVLIGSFDTRKLQTYRRIIKRYLPHLQVSEPFMGFDDSVRPDYFTVKGRQMSLPFESVVETASSLFSRKTCTLEYRPVRRGEDWNWYWVLLPKLEDAALASGMADTKGEASLEARTAARKNGCHIVSVRTKHPSIKPQQSALAVAPWNVRKQQAPAQP